jgi:hypothetical protein
MTLRRGQVTSEYAIALGVIIAAVIAMQLYMKRSIQAKIKDTADSASDYLIANGFPNTPLQYEPYYIQESIGASTTARDMDGTEGIGLGGTVARTWAQDQTVHTGSTRSNSNLGLDDSWN